MPKYRAILVDGTSQVVTAETPMEARLIVRKRKGVKAGAFQSQPVVKKIENA